MKTPVRWVLFEYNKRDTAIETIQDEEGSGEGAARIATEES
jgi:hypothetical protein